MSAGKYKKRIHFLKLAKRKNELHAPEDYYKSWFSRRCNIKTDSANDYEANSGEQVEQTITFGVRHCKQTASVSTKDRIKFGCKIFEIDSLENINEADLDIVFKCTFNSMVD